MSEVSFVSTLKMSLISFPSIINCNRVITNSLPLAAQSNNLIKTTVHKNIPKTTNTLLSNCPSPFPLNPVIQASYPSRHRDLSCMPFDAKNSSGSEEEDHRALDTVLKLYSAIKNQNIRELSDIIGDECRCVCNFFSFFQTFQGKQQVLDFFTYLIRSLGDNIEFVVKPTLHDGMKVGVSWRLEWNKKHVPLGKGFSFYICQIYQGKVFIRNVEMFMEPLLHIEPFRLKIMGYIMAMVDKLSSCTKSTGIAKKRIYTSVFILFLMSVILLFSKPGFY